MADAEDGPPELEEIPPQSAEVGGSAADASEPEATGESAGEFVQSVAKIDLNKGQSVYKLNLAHQEVDRILKEVEENCELVNETAGAGGREAWLPHDGLQNIILKDLGYEDEDEFEDALGGTFMQFIDALPHMEWKIQDDGSSVNGKPVFRMIPPPPLHARHGIILKLRVTKSEDLWRCLLKAPDATIEIPELEFEAGASQKRQIDAVFNHVTTACFNLGQHVREAPLSAETKDKIIATIDDLTHYLDIPHPWDIIVRDPSGLSVFKPDDGVEITLMDGAGVAEVA